MHDVLELGNHSRSLLPKIKCQDGEKYEIGAKLCRKSIVLKPVGWPTSIVTCVEEPQATLSMVA